MKKSRLLFVLASLVMVVGCNQNADSYKEDTPATMDDVSFPDDSETTPRPGSVTLPEDGSEAVAPLNLDGYVPNYYSNNSFNDLPAQWSGYGIHSPSIFKYKDSYYLYQSTPDNNVGIKAYKSKDLINWSIIDSLNSAGYVTGKVKETFAAKNPRVVYYEDEFHLYFSTPKGYKMFKSSSPEGPFIYECDLNYSQIYTGSIFVSPSSKIYFVSGGETGAYLYEMKSINEIDYSTRAQINATVTDEYKGATNPVTNPSLIDIDGTCYLTYSLQSENYLSYRSNVVSAVNPDYSSANKLAESFFNQKNEPLLINTNYQNGDVALGDLGIVEGQDMLSYYGYYSSMDKDGVRHFNISPFYYSGANIAFAHRETDSILERQELSEINLSYTGEEKRFTPDDLGDKYTLVSYFKDIDEIYVGYKSNNNTYVVSIDKENKKASLVVRENGLSFVANEVNVYNDNHIVKVIKDEKLRIQLDDMTLLDEEPKSFVTNKFGFKYNSNSVVEKTLFSEKTAEEVQRNVFKHGEAIIPAETYDKANSSIVDANNIKVVDNKFDDLYGSKYLEMKSFRDYARYLVDVKENGRYGVELVFNSSFTKYNCALGIRLGNNNEYVYQTKTIGESGFVRTLTCEFNVNKGANELLIENLSKGALKLVSLRLIKVSEFVPNYENALDSFATKGVHYVTDFLIDDEYRCHRTYENANTFAYVGDNTFTDFELDVEVAFSDAVMITGFVTIGFRCDNYVTSVVDNNESSIGYFLEISQYSIDLVKHQYGNGVTFASEALSNKNNVFQSYRIIVNGNSIKVYRGETLVFDVVDAFAISAGRLAFGSSDAVGMIRNMSVKAVEE